MNCAAGVCCPGDLSCTSFNSRSKVSSSETPSYARQVGQFGDCTCSPPTKNAPQYRCPQALHCCLPIFPFTVASSSLSNTSLPSGKFCSLHILKVHLVFCSRHRPCCGGCTESTSRAAIQVVGPVEQLRSLPRRVPPYYTSIAFGGFNFHA